MSYLEYNKFIKQFGISISAIGEGELALTKKNAIIAVNLLSDSNVVIFGGDVYELKQNGYLYPTYDNWYCNKNEFPTKLLGQRSREKALSFLENYKEKKGVDYRYVLVVDL